MTQSSVLSNRGVVMFYPELVAERLQLPVGTTIIDACVNLQLGGVIELTVTHPSLLPCESGEYTPQVTFTVESRFKVPNGTETG